MTEAMTAPTRPAAAKKRTLKILLVTGTGIEYGLRKIIETVLNRMFANSCFDAQINSVTSLAGAREALQAEDDYELAIMSANIRQTYADAVDSPAGLRLIDHIFSLERDTERTEPAIILFNADRRSIEIHASAENFVTVAATTDFSDTKSAAYIIGKALGSRGIAEHLVRSLLPPVASPPIAPG